MVEILYEKEKSLKYTYDKDLHTLERAKKAYDSGKALGPSLNQEHLDKIFDFLKLDLNGKTVVNLGCGHGVTDAKICKKFEKCNLIGVEFSQVRVDRCNEIAVHAGVHNSLFICKDIHIYIDEILKNNVKFDAIMAFEVMEHLEHQKEFAEKIKQCLTDDGVFFGSVPIQNTNNPPKQHIGHFRTIEEAEKTLGVEIIRDFKLRLPECVFFVFDKRK